ncbi:MAG: hypothetical protein WKG01_09000 [Kofleriaceae bacterium]
MVAALGACHHDAPITSCEQDLSGTFDSSGARWMLTERRGALEGYPLFDDSGRGSSDEVAPRWLELTRTPAGITGLVRRRYMRGAARCEAETPARIVGCAGDTLELVLADPIPPLSFTPCRFGRPDGSRRERWRRVR